MPNSTNTVLEVDRLSTIVETASGSYPLVDRLSFTLRAGETLGLVGESGCGKSMTCLSLLDLTPPGIRVSEGKILLEGRDLRTLSAREMRRVRGARIAIVFQEPMTCLNPVFTIGNQIAEAIQAHERVSGRKAWQRSVELLERVRIPSAAARASDYPHQLSGGMQQRVMIAMALAAKPSLLIADEPTTALDVTTQAEILDLLRELQSERGMGLLLVSHDLAVVSSAANAVAVMYAARIVEQAPSAALFAKARHPYTQGLIASIPGLCEPGERLPVIPGQVPTPSAFPRGCRFHPRCPLANDRCRSEEPELREESPGHQVACHHPEDDAWAETMTE